MRDTFDEIRQQIHEIRNLWGPFDIKLANLDHRITEMWVALEDRFGGVESKLMTQSFRLEAQGSKVADLWDRVSWIEQTLNIPARPARTLSAPAHEDKKDPEISPPQNPGR